MNQYAVDGTLGLVTVVAIVLIFLVVVLWIFLPFAVFGMKSLVQETQRKILKELEAGRSIQLGILKALETAAKKDQAPPEKKMPGDNITVRPYVKDNPKPPAAS